jgi:tol-pal system protein YbgF
MRPSIAVLVILLAACGSSRRDNELPATIPPAEMHSAAAAAASDARLAEMQTTLTELLDRLDVLNARIAKLESGAPVSGAPALPATAADKSAGAPQTVATGTAADEYRRAITLISQSKYAEARGAFQRVFDADTSGDLADNALFWIGETFFAAGNFSEAMRYYARVSKEYPDANKTPDAVFKMAIAYVRTGDLGMARRTFEEVIARYPYSSPAAAARMELKKIKY